ncbi:MAG: hypothetical protein ACOYYS_08160 [Chloroflexota bacterium]
MNAKTFHTPKGWRWLLLAGCLLLLLAGARVAYAELSAYELSWWTVDGGGGRSSGTGYMLDGTAGQADAGTLSGGTYTLEGGFWGGGSPAAPPANRIYAPLVIR